MREKKRRKTARKRAAFAPPAETGPGQWFHSRLLPVVQRSYQGRVFVRRPWERTPWRAVQRAAWEALVRIESELKRQR